MDGSAAVAAFKDCGVTHVVWIPDSDLGQWEPALRQDPGLRLVRACREGEVLTIPIGHLEGNYFCDDVTLADLRRDRRIVFRYATVHGEVTEQANPNGSRDNIAGISSSGQNVLGMMPHPERSAEPELGCTDGFKIFQSLVGATAVKQ